MLPPQSDLEVSPVVAALREQVDRRMNVVWNPKAFVTRHGGYDAMGRMTQPLYAGRWEVVIEGDPDVTMSHRSYRHICYVTETSRLGVGIQAMREGGAYAPVGMWLVEHMRMADYMNRQEMERLRATLDAQNDQLEADREGVATERAQEFFRQQFFYGTQEAGVSQFHPVRANLT